MQTGSAEMNSRPETFLTNKIAMSQYVGRGGERWEKEINKLFAARFPDLDAQAKALYQRFSNPNYDSGATQHHETPEALDANVSHPQSPTPPSSDRLLAQRQRHLRPSPPLVEEESNVRDIALRSQDYGMSMRGGKGTI
jgi:hypothetical protein